jgi:GT2 family glycosyltransferase
LVVAVVVTFNRRELLVRCLEALAAQTRPVARIVVVDNASTDRTLEYLEASGVADRIDVDYVRLRRNGGGAEGFHYGVRAALEGESEWLWLMDDDCEPAPDALDALLRAPCAGRDDAAVLAPVVEDDRGRVLPVNRGHVRPRWFFAPLVAATPEEYAAAETRIGFCSFVGPLVRTAAARRIGLPMREMFIRFEDVEYLSRLAAHGQTMWLVGASRIVHRDPQPLAGADLRSMWGDYAQRIPFAQQWKRLYGVRNQLWCGYRDGYVSPAQGLSQVLVQAVRTGLFHERRARSLRLLRVYARDARAGRFRNVAPARWPALTSERDVAGFLDREALSYDADVSEPPRRLGSRAPV